METAKLLEILTVATSAYYANQRFIAKFSDAIEMEDATYYENMADIANAKYRAYLNCYQIITGKTLMGIESVITEIGLLSNQL